MQQDISLEIQKYVLAKDKSQIPWFYTQTWPVKWILILKLGVEANLMSVRVDP